MSNRPITGAFNDAYIAEALERYRQDPQSVDESWRQVFRIAQQLAGAPATGGRAIDESLLQKAAGAAALASAIQTYGHLAVPIDPLGSAPPGAPELRPGFYGITDSDLSEIPITALGYQGNGTAADAIARLRELYCTTIGYEFEHLGDETERAWFRQTVEEQQANGPLTPDEKKSLLERLTEVEGFERFLGRAYVGTKRFSIEGLDVLVPMLDEAIARGAAGGARSFVIGMAHRGRLNVLTHVLAKPARNLLEEFEGHHADTNAVSETGDVKYHLGYVGTRELPDVGAIEIELIPNPSHLEFVNPVMMGVTRAKQRVAGGPPGARDETRVLPLLVHGDAAFPGEGVVAETLNLSLLRGYRVGGIVHVIGNNQVGFTTDPTDGRSTHYASDLAKGFDIPILHVNADDAQSCVQAMRVAIAYRKRFGKDVLIDVVGYRRHGHNEADQPAFTQPRLYQIIAQHPSAREVWGARLVRERVVSEADVKALDTSVTQQLQSLYEAMKKDLDGLSKLEHGHGRPSSAEHPVTLETAVRAERLVSLNEQLLAWPSSFRLHPTIQRTLPRRRDALQTAIDWGHAEALAFASLLTDGVAIRMTGQDVERGTFSHRHAVLHDAETGETFVPLANLPQAKAPFEISNSPLCETAVMGFEYGFSTAAPNEMVLWEAQFGDFANVAQPIVDQFIAPDRAKWGQDSAIVLLLPHGYEGQGPEHSSARLERYLQLVAEGNITVAYPTSPAQYFHVLRRQAARTTKRPLVLMQPKSLLRMPAAASKLDDLSHGTFQPAIDDPIASLTRDRVQRLVICTGKIYYDLAAPERPANVAILRAEELAPWPHELGDIVDLYPNIEDVVWAQEEPRNMGAWTYAQPRLRASVGTVPALRYVGRPERASPAEGYKTTHDEEQARIVRDALTYVPAPAKKRATANR